MTTGQNEKQNRKKNSFSMKKPECKTQLGTSECSSKQPTAQQDSSSTHSPFFPLSLYPTSIPSVCQITSPVGRHSFSPSAFSYREGIQTSLNIKTYSTYTNTLAGLGKASNKLE